MVYCTGKSGVLKMFEVIMISLQLILAWGSIFMFLVGAVLLFVSEMQVSTMLFACAFVGMMWALTIEKMR